MAQEAPQLTVAVPSYNVEQYLEHGLSSFDDDRLEGLVEVVVVDDGSSDATAQLAQRFVERRPGVFRLVRKENGGHGSAVNAGLEAARGRYFRVVDGDDWVCTDGLVAEARALVGLDADLVVDWRRDVRQGSGETEARPLPPGLPLGTAVPFDQVGLEAAAANALTIHTVCARTDFARACGLRLLEHTFYVDAQYVVHLTGLAATVAFLDIEVYQYLVGNASQSVAAPNYVRRFDDHDRVVRWALAFAEEVGESGVSEKRGAYLWERARLLVNTHYNIMLVYDTDRKRGRARARAFRKWLQHAHPAMRRATDRRYWQGLAAGAVGLDAAALDRLLGRMAHEA